MEYMDFFDAMKEHKVKYLVCGGIAVNSVSEPIIAYNKESVNESEQWQKSMDELLNMLQTNDEKEHSQKLRNKT